MILFCANALPSFIHNQGLRQFQPFLNVLKPRVILNQCGGDIQTRSNYFAEYITRIAPKDLNSIHIVAYSVAGLDIRYALTNHPKLSAITKSLITIGTPHKGSYLAELYRTREVGQEVIDPLANLLGVQSKYFEEINLENIRDFNLITPNKEHINYSSINAETVVGNMQAIFKQTGRLIEQRREYPLISGSDGIFVHSETKWGTHLATIDCDHSSLLGMPNQRNGEQTADVILQAIS